jgi:hypothetical protein
MVIIAEGCDQRDAIMAGSFALRQSETILART